jgi:hypothetical protein
MKRQGTFAAILLCGLTFGGMLTLFSQKTRPGGERLRSLDLGASDADAIDKILPAALETSLEEARGEHELDGDTRTPARREGRARLTLR